MMFKCETKRIFVPDDKCLTCREIKVCKQYQLIKMSKNYYKDASEDSSNFQTMSVLTATSPDFTYVSADTSSGSDNSYSGGGGEFSGGGASGEF